MEPDFVMAHLYLVRAYRRNLLHDDPDFQDLVRRIGIPSP